MTFLGEISREAGGEVIYYKKSVTGYKFFLIKKDRGARDAAKSLVDTLLPQPLFFAPLYQFVHV